MAMLPGGEHRSNGLTTLRPLAGYGRPHSRSVWLCLVFNEPRPQGSGYHVCSPWPVVSRCCLGGFQPRQGRQMLAQGEALAQPWDNCRPCRGLWIRLVVFPGFRWPSAALHPGL